MMTVSDEQLRECLETLRAVAALEPTDARYVQVERAVAGLTKTAKRKRRRARRNASEREDQAKIRRGAEARASVPASDGMGEPLNRQRGCSICKQAYDVVSPGYPRHCPSCAAVDGERRGRRADLSGRRALVTGGRIKIGHRLALKMLRDGAHVAVTTRFPNDARARFEAAPDAGDWLERLEVHAVHLGDLPGLLAWLDERRDVWPHLDIVVNNAAQTVRRPPAYYRSWAEQELSQSLARPRDAALTRFYERSVAEPAEAAAFPLGLLDEEALPLDLRRTNSWKLEAQDVSAAELAEVMVVNAIAPYLITTRLLETLERSPQPHRYVVHASALEGQFRVREKTPRHPHTNMAKAALNMFTRTSAAAMARRGVFMCSVDTGWITNENPAAERAAQRARGFVAPLDAEDGAARLYHPVLSGIAGRPIHGALLKDYVPVAW